MFRERPNCLLTATSACGLLLAMAGISVGQQDKQQDKQESGKQYQKAQNRQESDSERTLDRHSAEEIAKRMKEHGSSLQDSVTKAERETNGIAIEAQALIFDNSEFQRVKGHQSESDKTASRSRESQDREAQDGDREAASRQAKRGSDKLAVETLSVSRGNVELTVVIPETGEVFHLGSAPDLLASRSRTMARRTSDTEYTSERMLNERATEDTDRPSRIAKANSVIGAEIKNQQGESLGEIEDIALDHNRGRIAYAVVGFGGFLGMGEKLFAVPWNALEEDKQGVYILKVSKKDLKNAPGFDKDNWPDMANQRWSADVHAFYNTTPYWKEEGASQRHASTREFGRNVTSQEIRQVERLLQQSAYTLPKAIGAAEKRTDGKAILACAKLVSDHDFDRGESGDVQKQRDTNRSKSAGEDQTDRSTERRLDEQQAADRDQPFGQERLIIEVACLVTDDSGSKEFKKVIVNPRTGEITNERRMNSLEINPLYTRVASAR